MIAPTFFVIGQRRQIGKRLQPPILAHVPVIGERLGQAAEHQRRLGFVRRGLRQLDGLAIELQSANSIAGRCVHDPPAASMLAPVKLAGDQVSIVLDRAELFGDGGQRPPALGMCGRRLLQQRVDFIAAIEPT